MMKSWQMSKRIKKLSGEHQVLLHHADQPASIPFSNITVNSQFPRLSLSPQYGRVSVTLWQEKRRSTSNTDGRDESLFSVTKPKKRNCSEDAFFG